MTLVIAQLSDVHLGFSAERPDPNAERLAAVLAAVAGHRPDAIFITGDLAEAGDIADYRRLREMLVDVACPVHLMVGNHDCRETFAATFPDTPGVGGFVQYAVNLDGLRCLVLDTLEEGRQGGGFCGVRAAWLRAQLAAAPDQPTLIFLHHPPVATGVTWMDPGQGAAWIRRLEDALRGHPQVVGLAAGHVHAPSATLWNGVPVTVAQSVAPALALSLAPIDADRPDGRAMIADSPPGFALHRWDRAQLTTHFATVTPPILAHYVARWQPVLRQMDAERLDGA